MKAKKIITGAVAVLVVAGMCAGATYGFTTTYNENQEIKEMLEQQNATALADKEAELERQRKEELAKAEEDNKVEDFENVTIGEQYHIIPTTQISDAYKSKDTSKLNEEDKKTLEIASGILDSIIKDGMTDYEKELAVYTWMTNNIKFDMSTGPMVADYSNVLDRPYGVLQGKKSVCVGFATSFRLFMQMMDIECKVVHDSGSSHSWDLVKIDGDWYHVDCTFDAGNNGASQFKNFNIPDTAFSQSHSWDKSLYPAATGTKYTYAVVNSVAVDDYIKIPKLVNDSLKAKKLKLFLKLGKPEEYEKVIYLVNLISERMNGYYLDSVLYPVDTKSYVIGIFMNDNSEASNNESITTSDYQKIEAAVNKYFAGTW